MKEMLVHQWRDWLLKYVGDGEYQLIKKDTLAIQYKKCYKYWILFKTTC